MILRLYDDESWMMQPDAYWLTSLNPQPEKPKRKYMPAAKQAKSKRQAGKNKIAEAKHELIEAINNIVNNTLDKL